MKSVSVTWLLGWNIWISKLFYCIQIQMISLMHPYLHTYSSSTIIYAFLPRWQIGIIYLNVLCVFDFLPTLLALDTSIPIYIWTTHTRIHTIRIHISKYIYIYTTSLSVTLAVNYTWSLDLPLIKSCVGHRPLTALSSDTRIIVHCLSYLTVIFRVKC